MGKSSVDVVVVGAGFTGIYAGHKLNELGLSWQLYDKADGIGGTWWWNQYPGARCDIESLDYQYSFSAEIAKKWQWTERYSDAKEISAYIAFVAEELNLLPNIQLSTEVTSATYDERANTWSVKTNKGDVTTCTYIIWGTGCLSIPQEPKFKGLENFTGEWFHTGLWPKEDPEFAGKRIAVIGTGSSGVQVIPTIAPLCEEMVVFQRTPAYIQDGFNRPLEKSEWEARIETFEENAIGKRQSQFGVVLPPPVALSEITKEEANAIIEDRWKKGGMPLVGAFNDVVINPESNKVPAEFFANNIRSKVNDPELAEQLIPKGYYYGTKRVSIGNEYYETFNRENVELVVIKDNPIDHITETGLALADGTEYEFDIIVFATGYDAVTGALNNIEITGRDGKTLKEEWKDGPVSYLGIGVVGFPNMFIVTGPGSPSVFTNVVVSIEQHVDWIADAIKTLKNENIATFEPTQAAQDAWVKSIADVVETTLLVQTDSWYMGANIPGKPKVFLAYILGVGSYQGVIDEIAAKQYEGFALTPA